MLVSKLSFYSFTSFHFERRIFHIVFQYTFSLHIDNIVLIGVQLFLLYHTTRCPPVGGRPIKAGAPSMGHASAPKSEVPPQ